MEQSLERKGKDKNHERAQKGVNTDLNIVASGNTSGLKGELELQAISLSAKNMRGE